MQKRVMYFCWCFVLGVGMGTAFEIGVKWSLPGYIAGGVLTGFGVLLTWFGDKRGKKLPPAVVLGFLMLGAAGLGLGRYAEKAYIAPFNPTAPANHIRSILEAFPDVGKKDVTRIIGQIVAEPEYRPASGTPGVIALTIQPMQVEPEPGSGQVFDVSGGNIQIMLRPNQNFRTFEQDFSALFSELALPDGYGYIVEAEVNLQLFRPADNPGLFSNEDFYNDQQVFGSATISFWNKNAPPLIIKEKKAGNPLVELSLAIKKRMLGVIKMTVPFPESAFLSGVTLGARRGLDNVRCIFEGASPAREKPEESDEAGEGGTPPPEAGDEPDQRKLVLDEFRWSGTSHVLAVSGLHVTIIAGGLWGLFVALKLPKKVFAPLVVLGLAIFCLITGAAPSSTRAVIMNSLVVLTYVYLGASFRAAFLLAIGFAGTVILANNPMWIVQPAFALSFMAVISLALLCEPCDRVLKYVPGYGKLPVWVQQFIAAQGAIQFGMMGPLSAYYFCRMSLAGPAANFIAIPLIGIIVQLGIFACAIGMVPVVGIYIALLLNAANYLMIWFFLWTAHISTVLFPFPQVQTMTARMLACYYLLLGVFVWNKPILRHAWILYYDLTMGIGGAKRKWQAIAIYAGALVLIGGIAVYGFWPKQPDGLLHVNVLAVRYGQAIHIQTPSGANILVDAGPNDYMGTWNTGEKTITQYLLKQRIGNLDAVVLSGYGPEDVGGMSAIVRIFPIKRFFAPVPFWQWDAENPAAFQNEMAKVLSFDAASSQRNPDIKDAIYHFTDLTRALKQKWGLWRILSTLLVSPTSLIHSYGPPTPYQLRGGMVLWEEQGPGGKLEIIALHPDPDYPLSPSNNNSAVLMVRYGSTSFLLPGDLTEAGVRELLRLAPEMLRANLLVVPAHGSPKADVDLLYTSVFSGLEKDRYAVVSYGRCKDLKAPKGKRKSGGPGPDRESFLGHRQTFSVDYDASVEAIVHKLIAAGVTVGVTRDQGAILCTSDGKRLKAEPMIGTLLSQQTLARERQQEGAQK